MTSQLYGLNKEATEKQNAQNHDYRDNDDLDQTHDLLSVKEAKNRTFGL